MNYATATFQTTPQPAARPQPTVSKENSFHKPVLKVLGLGGGGSNAVNRMIELGLHGMEFIVANTDRQALKTSLAPKKIQLGPRLTRGLGAGGNPSVGQSAAEESLCELANALHGADMVFLTAGMGGGSGTGSIPVAAKISRALGAVTIAIVTTPFSFERGLRQRNANEGLAKLSPHTDTLIAIPNDRLIQLAPRTLPLDLAFRMADDVLRQAVQGISEVITETGLINVDFAHIRHVMGLGGGALMCIGHGEGENKAIKAVAQALHHPLMGEVSLENARGILANFTASDDLSLFEVQEALANLQQQAGNQAEIVMGMTHDERMQDRAQVILIATGLGAPTLEQTLPGFQVRPQEIESTQPITPPLPCDTPAILLPQTSPAGIGSLDIPAFLRKPRPVSRL
ncbi:MAG: cell division protein FtsZ [Chloroflexota bacterium]